MSADAPWVRERNDHGGHVRQRGPFGERSELIFSLCCGALTAIVWVLGKTGGSSFLAMAAFVGAYLFGA